MVVGASGLLGRHLVARALAAGGGPVAATTHRTEVTGPGVDLHPVDLSDGGAAAAATIAALRPAAVINAAYVPRGPHLEAVTARAPGAIAAACASVGARFVHLSSDVVFDGTTRRPYREDDPVAPRHDYGRAKAAAERAVAGADPTAVIVRTSLLWAEHGDPGPQVDMVTDPDVVFFTDEIRCPLRADDLAAACLELVARRDVHGVLHVAGPDAVSRYDFARFLAPLAGVDPNAIRGGPGPDGDRPRNCPLDTARARALLRTHLRGLHSGGS